MEKGTFGSTLVMKMMVCLLPTPASLMNASHPHKVSCITASLIFELQIYAGAAGRAALSSLPSRLRNDSVCFIPLTNLITYSELCFETKS